MKLQGNDSTGIPMNHLAQAGDFNTQVLGMEYIGRVGGNIAHLDPLPIDGKGQPLDRWRCGTDDVVFFAHPQPLGVDALDQDEPRTKRSTGSGKTGLTR